MATEAHADRVLKLVTTAHEEYERWLRRASTETPDKPPQPPAPLSFPAVTLSVLAVAALQRDSLAPDGNEVEGTVCTGNLKHHALYLLRTNNLGFSAHKGDLVIVDVQREHVDNGSVVIALHRDKVYARRLLKDVDRPGYVVLASEAANPLDRPPTVVLPTAELRILPIVGVLFNPPALHGRFRGEAVAWTKAAPLTHLRIACRIEGDSALPLALPGQVILGADWILPADYPQSEGRLVAIHTSSGAFFKRIGSAFGPVPHLRHFEPVGGLGDSIILRTEEVECDGYESVPLIQSAVRVAGVLYDLPSIAE